jgi:hypothetical protein
VTRKFQSDLNFIINVRFRKKISGSCLFNDFELQCREGGRDWIEPRVEVLHTLFTPLNIYQCYKHNEIEENYMGRSGWWGRKSSALSWIFAKENYNGNL